MACDDDPVARPHLPGLSPRRLLARHRPAGELALGLAVFALYSAVALFPSDDREGAAAAHGRSVSALEQRLHVDVELPLNHWLAAQSIWRVLANYEYAITYIVSAFGMLLWLYLRHPRRYPTARNSFVLINLVGAACFAVYPVMPPRLLPGLGFVDTVRLGHTWGSWGSPLVAHADQLAAMPSLHVAWCLWVSVELARLSARRSVQGLSAFHLLLTAYVIMATANHFLLDALGGVALVWLCVSLAERRDRHPLRVPAADAFFLAVETPVAPQHVGGVVLLETPGVPVTREDLVGVVQSRLEVLPRFRQRLSDGGRWHRPSWREHERVDWEWHVVEHDVTAPDGEYGGIAGLERLVADFQEAVLPKDRPLWRLAVVHGVAPGQTGVIFLMHHVVADGIGVITQALRLMDPLRPIGDWRLPRNGPFRRAAAIGVGLGQLAGDGMRGGGGRLAARSSPARSFGTVTLPLEIVREVARARGVRVTDVVLCAIAGGVRRVADVERRSTRITVPLMMRDSTTPPEGNYTAAVMIDVPVGDLPEPERLRRIARGSGRLRTGTRPMAARFVMERVGALLPAPLHRLFARSVYGGGMFQAIVSNLPGPAFSTTMSGAPVREAYPILPLAPHGSPIAVGAMSWDGALNFGICTDPELADAAELAAAAHKIILELQGER